MKQRVYDKHGRRCVLTRIGRKHRRNPSERWEVETDNRRPPWTTLAYFPHWWEARLYIHRVLKVKQEVSR